MRFQTLAALRFGFGVPSGAPESVDAMLEVLGGPDQSARDWPIEGLASVLPAVQAAQAEKAAAMGEDAAFALAEMEDRACRSTFVRAMTGDGFRERLVAFWADHFTVTGRGAMDGMLPYALVEDALRPNLTANFEAMLMQVVLHPAMLVYLDQPQSFGPSSRAGKRQGRGLNENLARELLELHTLGVGADYAQADVRAMAELLTGLTYDSRWGMRFDPRRAEPGAETVLGRAYGGDEMVPIRQVLRDLAAHPATARHICGKLAVHFVSDTPDPAMVDAMVAAWEASGGYLLRVYAAMLGHPAAWGQSLEKARQPFDFVVTALRALQVPPQAIFDLPDARMRKLILRPLAEMGQPWKAPRGPDGWLEPVSAWISPAGLAARIDWAMRVPAALGDVPDPVMLAERALAEAAEPALLTAIGRAETVAEGVGLVLASPAFNRR
jgi:uncharacterized protein (DUF1800 family)